MGDTILFGVLRMPYEIAMGDEISRLQYWQRGQQAADEIERLRAELHESHEYAGQLAVSLRRKHYSELPPFELQPDLYGRLTQIDNMTCGMIRAAPPEGK